MMDEEDKSLFHNAMTGVTPLKKNSEKIVFKKKVPNKVTKNITTKYPVTTTTNNITYNSNLLGGDIVFFAKQGLQPKTIKKMKQGKFDTTPPYLDLHGFFSEQAIEKLDNFVNNNKSSYLQIIHGKGYNSQENKPVLKNLVVNYFRSHHRFLAICSCPTNQGGTGAVFVLLKKIPKEI